MANPRQILERLKANENIGKVTHTMETVSSVRYRHYYKQWQESIDFYNALAQLAYLLVTAEQTIQHPLMESNESRTNAVLVIGSDRGLCGGYNSNLFKLFEVHQRMADRFNRDLKIYVKGRKVITYLENRQIKPDDIYSDFEDIPSAAQIKKIGETFAQMYLDGEIGRLSIVYNRFFSVSSQQAQTLTVLPVSELLDDLTTRSTVIWPWELSFEDFICNPSPEDLFDDLARMIVNTVIQGCFLEAALCEHLARVVAMRSATDNANEMRSELTKEYNRARQGLITTELLDITAGVEAMEF